MGSFSVWCNLGSLQLAHLTHDFGSPLGTHLSSGGVAATAAQGVTALSPLGTLRGKYIYVYYIYYQDDTHQSPMSHRYNIENGIPEKHKKLKAIELTGQRHIDAILTNDERTIFKPYAAVKLSNSFLVIFKPDERGKALSSRSLI